MARVLVTGARAPASLELIRLLDRAGHTVFVAESLRFHLSRGTLAARRQVRVPPPRQDPDGFLRHLLRLVERERIDWILPTCEEIFWVARGREELSSLCTCFCEPLSILRELHSKAEFIERARREGLEVPGTTRVSSGEELRIALEEAEGPVVVKPEFSRFTSEALVRPAPVVLERIAVGPERAWVVQECLEGPALSTWSVAHGGRLTAHAAYGIEFVASGAAVHFESLDHPASRAWVERFVGGCGFTGSIAFDFIEVPGRGPVAIECNPRLTSGLHLFGDDPEVVRAFFEPDLPLRLPPAGPPAMLAIAMLLYGWRGRAGEGRSRSWRRAFWSGRDVVLRRNDPWPVFGQVLALAQMGWVAARRGRDLIGATTWDIEYDGGCR